MSTRRVTIRLPRDVLEQLDAKAKEANVTRSRVVEVLVERWSLVSPWTLRELVDGKTRSGLRLRSR